MSSINSKKEIVIRLPQPKKPKKNQYSNIPLPSTPTKLIDTEGAEDHVITTNYYKINELFQGLKNGRQVDEMDELLYMHAIKAQKMKSFINERFMVFEKKSKREFWWMVNRWVGRKLFMTIPQLLQSADNRDEINELIQKTEELGFKFCRIKENVYIDLDERWPKVIEDQQTQSKHVTPPENNKKKEEEEDEEESSDDSSDASSAESEVSSDQDSQNNSSFISEKEEVIEQVKKPNFSKLSPRKSSRPEQIKDNYYCLCWDGKKEHPIMKETARFLQLHLGIDDVHYDVYECGLQNDLCKNGVLTVLKIRCMQRPKSFFEWIIKYRDAQHYLLSPKLCSMGIDIYNDYGFPFLVENVEYLKEYIASNHGTNKAQAIMSFAHQKYVLYNNIKYSIQTRSGHVSSTIAQLLKELKSENQFQIKNLEMSDERLFWEQFSASYICEAIKQESSVPNMKRHLRLQREKSYHLVYGKAAKEYTCLCCGRGKVPITTKYTYPIIQKTFETFCWWNEVAVCEKCFQVQRCNNILIHERVYDTHNSKKIHSNLFVLMLQNKRFKNLKRICYKLYHHMIQELKGTDVLKFPTEVSLREFILGFFLIPDLDKTSLKKWSMLFLTPEEILETQSLCGMN